MTEGELIEMAHRFRRLEDVCARANLILAAKWERHKRTIADLEKLLDVPEKYERACRTIAAEERDLDEVAEMRACIEKCLEQCREDMTAMQDKLRAMGACSR